MAAHGGEETILREGGVYVSPARFVASGVTYPIYSISSFRICKERRPLFKLALVLGCFGAFLLLGAKSSVGLFAIGLLVLLLSGVVAALEVISGATYSIYVATSGGEQCALKLKNLTFARRIIDSLSAAVAARSR